MMIRPVVILLMLIPPIALYGDDSRKNASSHRFENGGFDLPIVFEDQNFSESMKRMLLDDYNSVLVGLVPQGRHLKTTQRSISDSGRTLNVAEGINFSGRKKRPNGFEDMFGVLGVSSNNEEFLVIPKKLSDGYKSAFEIKYKHPKAFNELDEFIVFMNSLETASIPPVKILFYLDNNTVGYSDDVNAAKAFDFREAYQSFRYSLSSILDVRIGEGHYEGKLMATLFVYEKNGNKRIGEHSLIYDDGHWKILVLIPGT
jgi:hypothetical protein